MKTRNSQAFIVENREKRSQFWSIFLKDYCSDTIKSTKHVVIQFRDRGSGLLYSILNVLFIQSCERNALISETFFFQKFSFIYAFIFISFWSVSNRFEGITLDILLLIIKIPNTLNSHKII